MRQGRRVPAAEPGDVQRPGETRFSGAKREFAKPIALSAQVLLDRERCVLCQRCTRFSDQIAGDKFIDLMERGPREQIGIADGVPFNSYFSGNTVQICPVGALTGAAYRFRARPFDLVSTPSVVRALRGRLRAAHRPPARQGDPPAGRQRPRGQRGVELRQGPLGASVTPPQPDRLTRPLVRDDDGVLQPASWTEALAAAAAGLSRRARAGRRAHRRPAHRRGRLRLREVRPARAAHQRHRLPGPAALRRGGRFLARTSPGAASTCDLRRRWKRRPLSCWSGLSPRKSPRSCSCGCARRPASAAWPCSRWPRWPATACPSWTARCWPTVPGGEAAALRRLAASADRGRRGAAPEPAR